MKDFSNFKPWSLYRSERSSVSFLRSLEYLQLAVKRLILQSMHRFISKLNDQKIVCFLCVEGGGIEDGERKEMQMMKQDKAAPSPNACGVHWLATGCHYWYDLELQDKNLHLSAYGLKKTKFIFKLHLYRCKYIGFFGIRKREKWGKEKEDQNSRESSFQTGDDGDVWQEKSASSELLSLQIERQRGVRP